MSTETQNNALESAEPILRIGTDSNGELAIFTPRFNSVIARFTPCGKSGMKEGLLYAAPVAAQAPVFSVGVRGVGLIDDNPSALAIYFYAAPNNDDIRALHEIVSGTPVAAQSSAPAIPPEKPLPDLMMASYHEAIGWNKCRKAVIAAQAHPDPRTPAQQPVSGADGLTDAAIEVLAKQYDCHNSPGFKGFARAIEHLVQLSGNPGQLDHLPDATKMVEPPQNGSGFMLGKDRAKRIYIAGPMTGIEDFNFPAFNAAAQSLIEDGWHVENPADHGIVQGAEWEDYLAYDLTRLGTCGAIYLLPGWQASKGATLEVHIAQALGMEIFTAKGAIEPSGNSGGLPVSVRDALDWYAQQVGNCRRFGTAGDAARADLDADGGRRARAALAQQGSKT